MKFKINDHVRLKKIGAAVLSSILPGQPSPAVMLKLTACIAQLYSRPDHCNIHTDMALIVTTKGEILDIATRYLKKI